MSELIIEMWGGELCSMCANMKERLERGAFSVTPKDMERLIDEDEVKRREIKAAYACTDAFPILWYRDTAFTPEEFDKYLEDHGLKL